MSNDVKHAQQNDEEKERMEKRTNYYLVHPDLEEYAFQLDIVRSSSGRTALNAF